MKSIIQNCRLQIDVKCACPVVKQRFEKQMLVAFIWSLTLLVLLLRGRRQMGGGGIAATFLDLRIVILGFL